MATGRPRIEIWGNGGSTTLNGTINSAVTSLIVASSASFPSTPDFKISIDSEVITVTGISGNTFTVERGADGTTPASHTHLANINHYVTEGSLARGFQDAFSVPDYPYNRILEDATTLTASSFTWLNQGTATLTDADDGGLILKLPSEAAPQMRGGYRTAPTAPWLCSAYFQFGPGFTRFTGSGTGSQMGILARESSTGELYVTPMRTDIIAMWRMSNVTTFSADVDTFVDNEVVEMWIRFGDNNVDVFAEISLNGYDWEVCWNETRTAWMAGGIDQIGFYAMSGNAAAGAHFYIKSWILEDL